MDLYLIHRDLPIVLTKPGLLDVTPTAPTPTPPATFSEATGEDTGATEANIAAHPNSAVALPRGGGQEWPDGNLQVTILRRTGGNLEQVGDPITATRDSSDHDKLNFTLPSDLPADSYTHRVTAVGSTDVLQDGNLAVTAAPATTAAPDGRVAEAGNGEQPPPPNTPPPGGNTRAGNQSFVEGANGVTRGVNALTGAVQSGHRLGASLAAPFAGIGRGGRGGYGGYGGGFGGGYGMGGFGMGGFGIGFGIDGDQEAESHRLRAILFQLMMAIKSGDTRAIGEALMIVGLLSRKQLQKAGLMAVAAMDQTQQKMQDITDEMGALQADGNSRYGAQLAGLSSRMQGVNMDNQAITSMLRQVKAADDEIHNTEKSWQDVALRQQRQLAVWNA